MQASGRAPVDTDGAGRRPCLRAPCAPHPALCLGAALPAAISFLMRAVVLRSQGGRLLPGLAPGSATDLGGRGERTWPFSGSESSSVAEATGPALRQR